jgi:TctA family transporter
VTDAEASSRSWSDIALGGLLLVAGAVGILGGRAASSGGLNGIDGLDAGGLPIALGGLLVAVGAALLVRGGFLPRRPAVRWRFGTLLVVVLVIAAIDVIVALEHMRSGWITEFALRFGPPEIAALSALLFAVAIALARLSRLRAVGMVLLGLLLATVGLDIATGQTRLTLGLEPLVQGIDPIVVLLGLIIVADGVLCLVSPSLLLATYGRRVAGWREPAIPTIAAAGLRVVAVLAIAGAAGLAFQLHARVWDIGALSVFGLFGIAAKLAGWHRLVLIFALARGDVVEQSVRQTMMMSTGNPMILLQRPISATLLLLAGAVLATAALLSVRSATDSERAASTPRPR